MPRRLVSAMLIAMLAAACGAAEPSPSPVITDSPTAPPGTSGPNGSPAPSSPFAGLPYSLSLPDGWTTFDLSDPAGAAALDAFVVANPEMAAAIEAFKQLQGVTMAINPILGNVVVALAVPTGGLALDLLAATFTAQFAAVPGVVTPPQPTNIVLPVGPAVHWDIQIEANDPNGGTNQVDESVYLVTSDTTAVLIEFVEVGGAGIPQEDQIIQSLQFTP
jgi:hypothetical protein